MKTIAWTCAAALLAFPVSAADPPGFALWRASDLEGHDAGLSTHVGDGGERHAVGAGDIVHIPAGIPHSFLVPNGNTSPTCC